MTDRGKATEWKVKKVPATAVMGKKDYGIRFYGIPMGCKFSNLLESIIAVSKADSGLKPETREKLRKINQPLHLGCFLYSRLTSLPPAPGSPIRRGKRPFTADCVEATELSELVSTYRVQAVPKTVINWKGFIK